MQPAPDRPGAAPAERASGGRQAAFALPAIRRLRSAAARPWRTRQLPVHLYLSEAQTPPTDDICTADPVVAPDRMTLSHPRRLGQGESIPLPIREIGFFTRGLKMKTLFLSAVALSLLAVGAAGAGNLSVTEQLGSFNGSMTSQGGDWNRSYTGQLGIGNSSTTMQRGIGNLSETMQRGIGNNSFTGQIGIGNGSMTNQSGVRGHMSETYQSGVGNVSITDQHD
ncbi:hypothetical protein [Cereibacter sediminicola]|uniref:hypothetical protein n=1 Tax=Cereibacter sediminicola TaxID=2584941 RepID=UPI001FE5E18C|nr:hypothetical protein [Cereibacter sediminicola]